MLNICTPRTTLRPVLRRIYTQQPNELLLRWDANYDTIQYARKKRTVVVGVYCFDVDR